MTTTVFRDGLLQGVTALVAGPSPAAAAELRTLGANVVLTGLGDGKTDVRPVDVLVVDLRGVEFEAVEDLEPAVLRDALERTLEATWLLVHEVATQAMIPAGGGRVVTIVRGVAAGTPGLVHGAVVRAALENLMRVLSIEWARHGIRLNAVVAGDGVPDEEVASQVVHLVSPAGDFTTGAVTPVGY